MLRRAPRDDARAEAGQGRGRASSVRPGLKRILIVGGLVATLAFAAMAMGAVKHYRGPIQQGGHVTFQTKVKHHKTKRVKNFYFFDLKLTCDEAAFLISNKRPLNFPVPPMRVRHREFHGTFSQLGGTGRVTGKFTNHYKDAAGTLRVHAKHIQNTGFHNCDTGTVNWTAEKQ
jgi:hypothetical protein